VSAASSAPIVIAARDTKSGCVATRMSSQCRVGAALFQQRGAVAQDRVRHAAMVARGAQAR
jgi:hypothetical protein